MGRVLRSELPDGYFHVVSRSVYETLVYRDASDRRRFLKLLGAIESRHGWTCHAFCLMTTHYHLVLESTRAALSRGLHALNGGYATAFSRRHGRYGHLFAERYSARVIENESYLYDACAYVVLNPVKAGLCLRADEWPWSFSRYGVVV